jgi:hypothetical protein
VCDPRQSVDCFVGPVGLLAMTVIARPKAEAIPHRLLAVAACACLLLAACSSADLPSSDQMRRGLQSLVAVCTAASGDVELKRNANAYWEPAPVGIPVLIGDFVRTRKASTARINFLGGGAIELDDDAVVSIDTASEPPSTGDGGAPYSPQPTISVASGVARGVISAPAPGAEARPLLLKSAQGGLMRLVATAGKEPVAFRLTGSDKGTEVAVTGGEATLIGKSGERPLRPGQVVFLTDQGPPEVAELIDFPASIAPGVDARLKWTPGLAIRLAWSPVPRASGYRVELAQDLSFRVGLTGQDTDKTEMIWSPPGDGVYAWRVASRDAAGRLGDYGFARRIFAEKLEPRDLLVAPEDGAVFGYANEPPKIALTWEAAGETQLYTVVVASGADLLRGQVVNEFSSAQRFEVEGLTAGNYCWGVYVEGDHPEPIFTSPRRFTIKKLGKATLKAPKVLESWGK